MQLRHAAVVLLSLVLMDGLSARCAGQARQPGEFDYYVLSLSWSPQYCATTKDDSGQCSPGRKYGFVVHGLWPNALKGNHPFFCAGTDFDAANLPDGLLDVMPSRELARHEWRKHGTCSGLQQKDYFQRVTGEFRRIELPADVRKPDRKIETTPAALREQFAKANQAFPAGAFSVFLRKRYVREVHICLTKDFAPMECPVTGDTTNKKVILRPSR